MLKDFADFLVNVATNWTGERIAALVIGVLIGGLGLLVVGRWLRWFIFPRKMKDWQREKERLTNDLERAKEKCSEEQDKNKSLLGLLDAQKTDRETDRSRALEKIRALSRDNDKGKVEAASQAALLAKYKTRHQKLQQEFERRGRHLQILARQFQQIMETEGRFWEKPPTKPIPLFRPLTGQSAPIVAVMNLKGGVGKTTLTANLGGMLWKKGQRVLLADLDHQGTLTELCLGPSQVQDLKAGEGKLLGNVLKAKGDLVQAVWRNLVPWHPSPSSCVLGANTSLLQVEEDLKARWLINPDLRDVRYVLREALHAPEVQDRFDCILLDCPPRITTSCINALACADFVLIPVLLDKPSADAVPLLLGWLKLLKSQGVCPQLAILGVLGNRVYRQTKLTGRETNLWHNLQTYCQEVWQEPVYLFQETVPNKNAFADAAEKRALAAFDVELKPVFSDLVNEMLSRMVIHDRRQPASLLA
ncbi:MAG: AAA family ATPase [Gemmataceae bacterium]|nr:AAA family ATPase [Gemmataceae bacterium]MCI0742991.1 AAA family ATPase [Gemmataceae bacterium]